MQYVGWVPTAGGRLSFSMIGQFRHIKPDCHNEIHDDTRWIVCHQVRENTDIPLPFGWLRRAYARHCLKIDLRVHYLLVCHTSAHDGLQGDVFLFDHAAWRSAGEQSHAKLVRHVTSGQENLTGAVAPLIEQLRESARFEADIVLTRAGFCTVKVEDDPDPHEQEELAGKRMPVADSRYNAAQCYYFIKDLSHCHQNHSRHSDTLTTVHPVRGDDDSSWCEPTLKALYRSVLVQRRNKLPESSARARGMLAYIESFIKVCGARYGETLVNMPLRDNALLKEAIKAEGEVLGARGKFRELWVPSNILFRVLLPILGTMLGLFAALRFIQGDTSEGVLADLSESRFATYLEYVATLLAHHPEAVFVCGIVAIWLFRALDQHGIGGAEKGRFGLRMLAALSRRKAGMIALSAAFFFCLLLFFYMRFMIGFLS